MIERTLDIGRWHVMFFFCPDGYDYDELLDWLYDSGASAKIMREVMSLMESGRPNTGFTFSNPVEHLAIVAIGPTTSGEEFQDSLVHEVHHLAVAIAAELGIDLEGESPAYIAGDSARALADVVCELGCTHCR
jgi:hypothetical protein